MSAEDQLYRLIISWLDQREDFSRHLRQLASELESVNEKCNAGRAVGNTTTVIGGVAMIGAGVATFFSGGAAAPLLVFAGTCGGVGSTVTLVSKLIESWLESSTLKKAKKISSENKELGEDIQRRIQELTVTITDSSGLTVADDYVIECILRAIAKQIGIPWRDVMAVAKTVLVPVIMKLKESLVSIESGRGAGFDLEAFIRGQAGGFVRRATLDTLMVAGKGAVRVAGGAFTVGLTLPDTIENYKRAIKNNNVTGPSEELKKAADELMRTSQNFREALNEAQRNMRRMHRSR